MAAKKRFQYQKPTDEMVRLMQTVREHCADLDDLLFMTPGDGRCIAIARTKLEEVSMWANKGIVFAGGTD